MADLHAASPVVPSTADWQEPVENATPTWLVQRMRALETSHALDRPVLLARRLADRAIPSPELHGRLRGDWFGHALHPLLTDFPLGAFMSVSLLDLFGGRRSRPAATGLLGFGLAMTVPTAATGLAEWKAAGRSAQRVGLVHAAANSVGAGLYAMSMLARLRGRHYRGVGLALLGGGAATVGGYLGGHLSLVRKVGSADPAHGPAPDPARS
jgi:uncharacterized membrane protein